MRTPFSNSSQPEHWLILSWVTAFLVGTDLFIIAPLLPSIGQEMHVAPASLAVLVSVFSVTYAITSPIFGRFAQRHGLSRQLRMGVFLLGMANVYTALAPSVLQLACSRLFAGLGAASITPILYALVAERATAGQRGRSLAVISSGLVLALAGGAPLGLLLGGLSNWRWVFGGLGVALIATLPAHRHVWSALREQAVVSASTPVVLAKTEERLLDAWPLFLGMVLWAASVYCTYTLIGTALEDARKWPLYTVAAMLVCFGVGATVGSLSGGRLADVLGATAVIRWNFLLAAMAFAVAAWMYQVDSPWLLGPTLFVIALLAYGVFPALQTRAAEQFHDLRPVVLGLLSSALYVGITVGASGGAALYQRTGMVGVVLGSSCVAVTGHLLGWWLPSRRT